MHPWGPTGHRLLAELLIRLVQATAVGLSIQPLAAAEARLPREQLVPPLTPGNYETNTSSCWLGVSCMSQSEKAVQEVAVMACTAFRRSWHFGRATCAEGVPGATVQDDFHTLVDATDGFAWINERPEATEKKAQVGWGWRCRQAGLLCISRRRLWTCSPPCPCPLALPSRPA